MTRPGGEGVGASPTLRVAWVLYSLLALGGIVWLGSRRGTLPLSVFLSPSAWPLDLLVGAVAGGILLVGWRQLARRADSARRLERAMAEALGPLEAAEVAVLSVLSGLSEELFFRGAMLEAWGWPVSLLVFAVLHTGPGPGYRVWTLFAALAGGLFTGLVLWRGNLLPAVVAHVLVNAVNLWRIGGPGARLAGR